MIDKLAVVRRLKELEDDLKEEGEGQHISNKSLIAFYNFIKLLEPGVMPAISLDGDGNICCHWQEHFFIHRPSFSLRFINNSGNYVSLVESEEK